MKRILAALCVVLSAATAAAAPGGGTASASVEIPYEQHILPNGLTLIIHEDHKTPIAAVNVWYHVGSKDERPGKTGFAHLFEHLMFNGSENHNDEFFRPLESAGATGFNGTTNNDRTNYFENVPTSALDLTLWLESDRMGHLLGAIDQAKLDEQRGVVQNEKRQRETQPYGKVFEVIASATYPAGHPYSWTTIGSMEDLNAASLEDVKDWFRSYYGAANAVLVVAGDVNPAEVKKKVELYFGDIPSGPTLRRQQQWIAKMSGEKRALLQDRVPQARIYKVWNVPGTGQRDSTLLDLAAERLGGGKTSLLYERLVYKDQIATDASAFYWDREIGGQFYVTATVKPGGDLKAAEKALDEVVAKFLKDGPGSKELERIKTYSYASWVRGAERIGGFGGKSDILASSQVYGGSPDDYKRYLNNLRTATPAAVREVARRWLGDGVFVLTVLPAPDYTVAKDGADRSKLPAPGEPPPLKLPPLQRATLANGLRIALAERRSVPVVELSLMVDGGTAADDPARPGTERLMQLMLQEGAGRYDALQLAQRKDELAASIGVSSNADSFFISLSALKSKLDDSLALYSDVVLRPSFPEKELPRVKQNTLAALQQSKVQPTSMAWNNIPRLIYGADHPYAVAYDVPAVEKTVQEMTPNRLRAFYRRWVRPDNATLLIVGDTTLAEIMPLLEKHFGGWKPPAEALPRKNLPAVTLPAQPRVFLINRTGAEQSYIVAAQLAPPTANPDEVAMQTVNTVLGGMFISRLNMNLREDKHWSYGAGSSLRPARGQRMFGASASAQRDHTAESLKEMLKELQGIAGQKPLTGAEIDAAKKTSVLSLPGDNETNAAVLSSYSYVLDHGLPDSYYNDLVGKVLALTPAELAAAAGKLVHPEALTWVVVGDLAKIEDGIRQLKLGEVKVLDVDGKIIR